MDAIEQIKVALGKKRGYAQIYYWKCDKCDTDFVTLSKPQLEAWKKNHVMQHEKKSKED